MPAPIYTESQLAPNGNFPGNQTNAPAVTMPAQLWQPPIESIPATPPVEIYVAPSGSDTTGDGTFAKPYATIDKAVSNIAPGQTVYLRGGVYQNAKFGENALESHLFDLGRTGYIRQKSGTDSAYCTLRNYPGEVPIIRGDLEFGLVLSQSNYWIIQGIEFEGEVDRIPLSKARYYQYAFKRNSITANTEWRVPILNTANHTGLEDLSAITTYQPSYFSTIGLLLQDCHHIEVRYCTIHHWPGTGLRASGCDYLTIDRNIIHNNSRRSAAGNHGLIVHTPTQLLDSLDQITIRITRNFSYENFNQISSWSPQKTILHYGDNGVESFDEGLGLSFQKAHSSWKKHRCLIANNLVARCGKGINTNTAGRCYIINNTLFENHVTSLDTGNAGVMFSNGGAELYARNNAIFFAAASTGISVNADDQTYNAGGVSVASNFATHAARSELSSGVTVGNLVAIDPANCDLRLAAGSVGRDIDRDALVNDDILVDLRSAATDAGCYN